MICLVRQTQVHNIYMHPCSSTKIIFCTCTLKVGCHETTGTRLKLMQLTPTDSITPTHRGKPRLIISTLNTITLTLIKRKHYYYYIIYRCGTQLKSFTSQMVLNIPAEVPHYCQLGLPPSSARSPRGYRYLNDGHF